MMSLDLELTCCIWCSYKGVISFRDQLGVLL